MPWRKWDLTEWNGVLLRYFFYSRSESDTGPILQLVVTAEEFARAAGEKECLAAEVSRGFLDVMCTKLASSGLLLGSDALETARPWLKHQNNEPPFVSHLILTCFIASDISEERAAEGNFRRRLDNLLGCQKSGHALKALPPLWKHLASWLGQASQRQRGSRELILPEVGWYTIIGIPLLLSFPPRSDELRLVELLDREGLLDQEPPVRIVLALLEKSIFTFGKRFRQAFGEFRSAYRQRSLGIEFSPFWSAIRGAALSGNRKAGVERGIATLMMEDDPDDEGHFRLAVLIDEKAITKLPSPLLPRPLDEPLHGCPYVLTKQDYKGSENIDEATRWVLGGAQLPWRVLARASQEGVLLFTEDDEGAFLNPTLPESGRSVNVLIRNDLSVHFVEALCAVNAPYRALESNYLGWLEVRAVKSADLLRVDFASVKKLASIRCLQTTLAPAIIHLRGGLRLESRAWLSVRGFLPVVSVRGASKVILQGSRPESGAELLQLERQSHSDDVWCFPAPASPREGEYQLSAQTRLGSTRASLVFRDTIWQIDYREPQLGTWMTESISGDVVDVAGPLTTGVGSAEAPSWLSPVHIDPNPQQERSAHERDCVERFIHVVAAISLRRRGISEQLILDIISKIFSSENCSRWDILRSWEEVGALCRLISRKWRSTAYFPIQPRLVAYRTSAGAHATLLGLAPPAIRLEVLASARQVGVQANLDWAAASAVTPPLLRLQADGVEKFAEISASAGLADVEWLQPPEHLLRPVTAVLASQPGSAPKNYDVFRHWSWNHLQFLSGPGPAGAAVSLDWMRRPDAPDYYLVRREDNVLWWGRSRVWAFCASGEACGKQLFSEHDGNLDCIRPGQINLPVGLARMSVALGAPPPGPIPSAGVYRYGLPSGLHRIVVTRLWPRVSRCDSETASRLRWLEAAARSNPKGPTVALPANVRTALRMLDFPAAERLASRPRIALALMPLLLGLTRQLHT